MTQKRHITRPIRIAIMVILIALFLVIAPLVVLYTAGYRYNFDTKQIIQTGVITIDVKPKNATVRLNDEVIVQSMPMRVSNLMPNIYTVSIDSDGYFPWKKSLLVHKKKTTYINDIHLIRTPTNIDKNALALNNIVDIQYSPNGRFVLFVKQIQTKVYEFSLIDITNIIPTEPIMRTVSEFSPTIHWSPTSQTFLIETQINDKHSLKIVDALDRKKSNTYAYQSTGTLHYYWHKDQIIFGDGTHIYAFSPTQTKKISRQPNTVWFLDTEQNVWTIAGKKITNASASYPLKDTITDVLFAHDTVLIAKSHDDIVFIDLSTKTPTITYVPGAQIKFISKSNEWLVWSDWEVWRVDAGYTPTLVNRFGTPIVDVDIFDSYGALAISFQDDIAAYYPNYNVTIPIFSTKKADIAIHSDLGVLLFLDAQDNLQRLIQYKY